MLSDEQLHDLATGYFAEQWAVDKAIMLMQEVEAEVRKDYDALIRQMLEAIEAETSDTWECDSYHPKLYDAVVAAKARLGEMPA